MSLFGRTFAALVILVSVALATEPKTKAQSRFQARPKPQTSLRALATPTAQRLIASDSGDAIPVMIVPVPVVEVVVVGDAAIRNSTQSKIEEQCINEMKALMQDQQRMEKSQQCEKTTGHAQSAIKQLETADSKGAEGHVEKLFSECAQLSPECAKQMAPDVIIKMRLSGVAISDQCMTVGKTALGHEPSESEMACQDKIVEGIGQALMQRNMDGALTAAQKGLQECHKVESPCDFQLAPVLVMNLLQQAAGGAAEPEPEPEMPEISLGLLEKAQSTRKMSLLDVATKVRVTSRMVKLRA